jgi:hypothetical protein
MDVYQRTFKTRLRRTARSTRRRSLLQRKPVVPSNPGAVAPASSVKEAVPTERSIFPHNAEYAEDEAK